MNKEIKENIEKYVVAWDGKTQKVVWLSKIEYEYWMKNLLPFGCFIITKPIKE